MCCIGSVNHGKIAMAYTITHFMWPYQGHFRIVQQCAAESVFQTLEPRFRPKLFLVGLRCEEQENCFPACVEPEDDFWIASEEFNDIFAKIDESRLEYPESRMIQSHHLAQASQDIGLLKRATRDAVENMVNGHSNKPSDLEYFVSLPTQIGSYYVCAVLGLQKTILSTYYRLTISEVPLHSCRMVPVARSLLHATIAEFLHQVTEEMETPEPGRGISSNDAEETIRAGASHLVTGCVWRVDKRCISGMHTLYRACNAIASLHYERQAGSGTLILARNGHAAIRPFVTFSAPTDITNYRAARKLLELAAGDVTLHTDSERIYGLVKLGSYCENDEDLFEVRILEHHHWELLHAGRSIMRVRYGQPYLHKPAFDRSKLSIDLPRIFPGIASAHVEQITSLVVQAEQGGHGTTLVITEAGEAEAKRLSRQATPIAPVPLSPDVLKHLTPIDGAVLLSPDGICHAIGVILDGKATQKGDPGRGARFNSALRYIEASVARCLAIVVSEDRGIDFLPNLRPPVNRSGIDDAIAALDQISHSEKIRRAPFVEIMEWLEEHRFYLLGDDCNKLNTLVGQIDARLDEQNPNSVRIIRQPFIPNPEMDAQIYYWLE
jgi:hypothetical protein